VEAAKLAREAKRAASTLARIEAGEGNPRTTTLRSFYRALVKLGYPENAPTYEEVFPAQAAEPKP